MIGRKIHSYEIVAHLGKGGMGNVYKATDTMLGRSVALKMLHPQLTVEAQFLERFKKEARLLAQLLHPNIAVIYNFIEQDENYFMVMEYVEGTNLDDLLKAGKAIPAAFVVPVFVQVLEGLQHAHKKNIFHRDIKPANIMITPEGMVKLMDFGIAKMAGEQKLTQVNKIVGTVEFMAPELIQGNDASASSDIYAAGIAMYELLAGKLPFEGETDFNLMQAILKQKITQPLKFNAAIPKALSDIVMKAIDKNPANRYADARSFQLALQSAFPGYTQINMTLLQKAAAPETTVQDIGVFAGAGKETVVATGSIPGSGVPAFSMMGIKQHVVQNKRIYLVAVIVLLLLVIGIPMLRNNNNTDEKSNDESKAAGKNVSTDRNPYESVVATPVQEAEKPVPVNQQPAPVQKEKTKQPVADKPPVKKESPVVQEDAGRAKACCKERYNHWIKCCRAALSAQRPGQCARAAGYSGYIFGEQPGNV
jgi:eukaryotic-like serine/threonine-protein kinase